MTDGPIGRLASLPAFFRLEGRRCALAGEGEALAWKAELAAAAGARVDVFAPEPHPRLAEVAERTPAITLHRRGWTPADLAGAALAIVSGEDEAAAKTFAAAARAAGAPVNVIDRPALCDFSFGAIVNRSPLVLAIATDGAAPVFAQALRARLEALLPVHLADWAAAARDWRARLAGLGLGFRSRRRFWERFAERALSRDAPPGEADFAALAGAAEGAVAAASGEIVLVGAGPGDPRWLTLEAVRALQSADVVLHDDLVGAGVLELARREARRVPVGKRGYAPSAEQSAIAAEMVALAREGKVVVRLKGGDPMVFGRANEEIAAARAAGIPIRVAPGVTTALAAAAELGASLSDKRLARRIQFVTAHGPDGALPDDLDWRALIDPDASTVVYMGRRALPGLVARLLAEGLDPATPAALMADVGRPGAARRLAPIGAIVAATEGMAAGGPAVLLYGRALATAREAGG